MAFDPVTLGAAVQLAKDPATIKASVDDWLDDHPEATTTVQDGSITKAKLRDDLAGEIDDNTAAVAALEGDVGGLKSAINYLQDKQNLFDSSTTTEGRLQYEGSIAVVSGYFTSALIPVISGKTYYKNSSIADAYHRLCTYSATQHFVRSIDNTNYITINSGEAYIRFSGTDEEKSETEFYEVTAKDTVARAEIDEVDTKVDAAQLDIDSLNQEIEYMQDDAQNLFDTSTVSDGRLQPTGNISTADPDYFTSAFIPVTSGNVYRKNSPIANAYHRMCVYSSTQHTLRSIDDSNYVEVADGEAYIRFSGLSSEKSTASFCEVTTKDTTARNGISALNKSVGYGFFREADILDDVDNAGVGITRVADNALHNPASKAGYVITMARTATVKAQIFVYATNTSPYDSGRLFTRYFANNAWQPWTEYANKTDISSILATSGDLDYSGNLNDTPNGVYRVSANATNNPTGELGYLLTVLRASTARGQIFWSDTSFRFRTQASGVWGDWQGAGNSSDYTDRHNGYTFGDSLMAQDGKIYEYDTPQYNLDEMGKRCFGWQSLLRNKFGVTITDYAVGGQSIRAQRPIIMSKTYDDVDFVIISTGVNDYSESLPMGTLPTSRNASFTNGRFIDDMCESIEYILHQNPKIKIMLFTPCHRDTTWRNSGVSDFSKAATDCYTQNNVGLYLKDYAEAIRDIGKLYSCVVCDMYAKAGLNYITLPEYTFEGVHPTNAGYLFTAPVLYDAFKQI